MNTEVFRMAKAKDSVGYKCRSAACGLVLALGIILTMTLLTSASWKIALGGMVGLLLLQLGATGIIKD